MHIHLVKQNSRRRGVIAVHLLARLHTLTNAKYSRQQARVLSRARTIASRTRGKGVAHLAECTMETNTKVGLA